VRARAQALPRHAIGAALPPAGASLRRLRSGAALEGVRARATLVVTRFTESQREVVEVSPLAAELLGWCRRPRTMRSLARCFARRHPSLAGIDGRVACAHGVRRLVAQRLLDVR
jgi:hypothetical protein